MEKEAIENTNYKLVWENEFEGDKLNMDDWNYEYHEPGWVNAELQEYVDSEKIGRDTTVVVHEKGR